jgi:predicted transposase/invertase (TIGR01784 family)
MMLYMKAKLAKQKDPHDRYFKYVMGNPEVMRAFLLAHLPSNIIKYLDLNSIVCCKSDFIHKKLSLKKVDILYQIKIVNTNKTLFILPEHQRTVDKFMLLRHFEYCLAIMRYFIDHDKKTKLPLVLPLVIYNGTRQHAKNLSVLDFFGAPAGLIKRVLFQPIQVINLNEAKIISQSSQNTKLVLMELVMMLINDDDFVERGKILMPYLTRLQQQGEEDFIVATFNYIISAVDQENAQQFIDRIKKIMSDNIGGTMASVADQLVESGRKEGWQIGFAEGEARGELAGKRAMAKALLAEGVDVELIQKVSGLTLAQISKLERITETEA